MPAEATPAVCLRIRNNQLALSCPLFSQLASVSVGGADLSKIVKLSPEPLRDQPIADGSEIERQTGGATMIWRKNHLATFIVIFMLKSTTGAEWVRAPEEIKSTPVSAI